MHHAELHVYNFRRLPHAGIRIGRDSLIGEFNVVRGQGGVTIGDRVFTSPMVQIMAVNHVFDDPHRPTRDVDLLGFGDPEPIDAILEPAQKLRKPLVFAADLEQAPQQNDRALVVNLVGSRIADLNRFRLAALVQELDEPGRIRRKPGRAPRRQMLVLDRSQIPLEQAHRLIVPPAVGQGVLALALLRRLVV